jgi:hypothetical protein
VKNDTIRKILLYLVIAFVVVSIWQNPEGAAEAAGDFLGSVGEFFSELIDRTATFIGGLFD